VYKEDTLNKFVHSEFQLANNRIMQTVRIRCVQRIYTCHTLRKKALKCKITHSLCQNRF